MQLDALGVNSFLPAQDAHIQSLQRQAFRYEYLAFDLDVIVVLAEPFLQFAKRSRIARLTAARTADSEQVWDAQADAFAIAVAI